MQTKQSDRSRILAAYAHAHDIVAGFQNIRSRCLIIGSKIRKGKGNGYFLALSRCQFLSLGKSAEILICLIQFYAWSRYIDLHHLLTCPLTCIGHLCAHRDLFAVCADTGQFVCKFCIGQAITKWKECLFVEGIKIAVANIDAFLISGIIDVLKVIHRRILIPCRPGRCQFTGWILSAKQDVYQGCSGIYAKL